MLSKHALGLCSCWGLPIGVRSLALEWIKDRFVDSQALLHAYVFAYNAGSTGLLSPEQLSFMADYFTNALCCLKHNGAVDKTQQGFAALCEQ